MSSVSTVKPHQRRHLFKLILGKIQSHHKFEKFEIKEADTWLEKRKPWGSANKVDFNVREFCARKKNDFLGKQIPNGGGTFNPKKISNYLPKNCNIFVQRLRVSLTNEIFSSALHLLHPKLYFIFPLSFHNNFLFSLS